jgi:uncharacterized membrane protein YdjX (TVP38/TMEM64 family)
MEKYHFMQKVNWRLVAALILVFGAGLMSMFHSEIDAILLGHWIGNNQFAGSITFILLFAGTTVLLVPGLFFTLAGGVIFGPFLGTLFNLIGATIGACLSFLISRYIASDWIEKKFSDRINNISFGVENGGWQFIAFLRLAPVMPFFLVNYILGLTKIKFSTYAFTTAISLIPSVFTITYIGHLGHETVIDKETLVTNTVVALSFISVLIFTPYFLRKFFSGTYKKTRSNQHND